MGTKRKLNSGLAAVVTGASSGIGRELAVLLAHNHSARLILTARDQNGLDETKRRVDEAGGRAMIVATDIGVPGSAEAAVETCIETFGRIDVLINNAGFTKPGTLHELTARDFEEVFAVNFFAPVRASLKAIPFMSAQGSGKIVNISSLAGRISVAGRVCYASSKFALTGFSEGMASELEVNGIDVITVLPGYVRTEFFVKNKINQFLDPTEIAEESSIKGLLMRHILSTSAEKAAIAIHKAMTKGGPQEIILTIPAVVADRINGLMPGVMFKVSRKIGASLKSTKQEGQKEKDDSIES